MNEMIADGFIQYLVLLIDARSSSIHENWSITRCIFPLYFGGKGEGEREVVLMCEKRERRKRSSKQWTKNKKKVKSKNSQRKCDDHFIIPYSKNKNQHMLIEIAAFIDVLTVFYNICFMMTFK